jgi:DNA-binding XRE family transcriptional regulator
LQTIRELRHERGWTQFELALLVGVQPQAIYLWETGRRTPQVAQLRKLGEIFGLCSDEIVLVPPTETNHSAHRPRAGLQPAEPVPGRTRHDLVTSRGNTSQTSPGEDG